MVARQSKLSLWEVAVHKHGSLYGIPHGPYVKHFFSCPLTPGADEGATGRRGEGAVEPAHADVFHPGVWYDETKAIELFSPVYDKEV